MPRNKGGRPQAQIDLAVLEKLAGLQCTDDEIAAFLGFTRRTLARHKKRAEVAEAIERGKLKGRTSLRRYLFEHAAKGNAACTIFLAKNLLGMRDTFGQEISGPGGGPIEYDGKTNLKSLSDDELQQLAAIHQKLSSGSSGSGDPPEG